MVLLLSNTPVPWSGESVKSYVPLFRTAHFRSLRFCGLVNEPIGETIAVTNLPPHITTNAFCCKALFGVRDVSASLGAVHLTRWMPTDRFQMQLE